MYDAVYAVGLSWTRMELGKLSFKHIGGADKLAKDCGLGYHMCSAPARIFFICLYFFFVAVSSLPVTLVGVSGLAYDSRTKLQAEARRARRRNSKVTIELAADTAKCSFDSADKVAR